MWKREKNSISKTLLGAVLLISVAACSPQRPNPPVLTQPSTPEAPPSPPAGTGLSTAPTLHSDFGLDALPLDADLTLIDEADSDPVYFDTYVVTRDLQEGESIERYVWTAYEVPAPGTYRALAALFDEPDYLWISSHEMFDVLYYEGQLDTLNSGDQILLAVDVYTSEGRISTYTWTFEVRLLF